MKQDRTNQLDCKKRQEMVDKLTARDILYLIYDFSRKDFFFIISILQGEGWVPYSQLSDEQLQQEYESLEEDEDSWMFASILEAVKGK